MKRRISLILIPLLLLHICLPAYAETAQPDDPPVLPSLTDRLFLLFGSEEAVVLDALKNPIVSETAERHAQKTLTLSCADDDSLVSASLTFYNGVLMACEYAFNSSEAAYLFAQDALTDLESSIGEKTTYPGVIADRRGCLSELTDASELQELFTYYEDWTPEVDEAVIRQLVGETPVSRIDLRLELSILPADTAVVSMKYMAIRSSLR